MESRTKGSNLEELESSDRGASPERGGTATVEEHEFKFGRAEKGTRTLDHLLGKQELYQLSYFRGRVNKHRQTATTWQRPERGNSACAPGAIRVVSRHEPS